MKEINATAFFTALNTARATTRATGNPQSVRLSDYAEKGENAPRELWAAVPYCIASETPESEYFWHYADSRADAIDYARRRLAEKRYFVRFDVLRVDPDDPEEPITAPEDVEIIR